MDPTPQSARQHLDGQVVAGVIIPAERDLLIDFIEHRNAISPTGKATQKKQAFQGTWICGVLHGRGRALDTCTVRDLLAVASKASSGAFTQNTRQTKIATLKGLAKYIDRFHHKIPDLDLLGDVKTGCADKGRKQTISVPEWERVLNARMSAKERGMIATIYDGYHRPREILLLKWSDLKVNRNGHIEYEITFKTEKTRTIVQKGTTTAILEMWRQECGANYGDETPVFPDRDGQPYQSTTVLRDLFARLRKQTGIASLSPGSLRNIAITHDVEAGLPTSYICLRAWGEPYNPMINVYARPDSGRMQEEQHKQNGLDVVAVGASVARVSRNVIVCPRCKIGNPHEAMFCYGCGWALTSEGARVLRDLKSDITPNLIQEMIAEALATRQTSV